MSRRTMYLIWKTPRISRIYHTSDWNSTYYDNINYGGLIDDIENQPLIPDTILPIYYV